MQQVFAIEKHREQPNQERACNIDQKRRERKSAIIMFVDPESDQITGQRTHTAATEYEKVSNQQSTDFNAGTAKLSA